MSNTEDLQVSRKEFDINREMVSKDIAGLALAIKEEGKGRAADTRAIRSDIKELVSAQTMAQTAAVRPNITALGFSFSILTFVIFVVAGVYAYMNNQMREEQKNTQAVRSELQKERDVSHKEILKELQRRTSLIEEVVWLDKKP